MRRKVKLLEKRKQFVEGYIDSNQHKQMKIIVADLSERLFLSERTIYNIINE